jgi:N-acylneuraminate cytidylyltransferase
MRKLAIITARGGSKRIPKKNVRNFLGKPIISYSIKAALASNLFDTVMVSTDDHEIADISIQYGAEVPFLRSAKNSNDFAGTTDVILEVINQFNSLKINFDQVCCIYPTAPLISEKEISEAYNIFQTGAFETVFPVVGFSYPIQRSLIINQESKLEMLWPENLTKRSQDLTPCYHDAGQFYWLNVSSFVQNKLIFSKKSAPYILDEMKVQDIDNESDWRMAELKYEFLYGKK